jgi:D-alanine-D-alanine ligase
VVEGLADVAKVNLPFPLFAKPVAEGSGKGISPTSKVTTLRSLRETCRRLLQRFRQPVLVEGYLPGREFTVGILGTAEAAEAVAVLEVVLGERAEADAYGYLNKKECHERVKYVLVDDAEAQESARVALAAWRALGCRDGGRVDLRSDAAGRPQFLEVNPLAGLHPTFSDLPIGCTQAGIDYDTMIGRIVESALARIAKPARAAAAA